MIGVSPKIIYVIIAFILLIGENVMHPIGIYFYSFLTYASVLSMMLLLFKIKKIKYIEGAFPILIFSTLYYLYRAFIDRNGGITSGTHFVGGPLLALVVTSFDSKDINWGRRVAKLLFVFFVIEVTIAILERITGHLIFGWFQNDEVLTSLGEDGEFRSTALHGHPLQNALIVTSLMLFILVSPIKNSIKMMLWSLGFISILCFNTRAAMVLNLVFLLIYTADLIVFGKGIKISKTKLLIGVALITTSAYFILTRTTLGGRLLDMGLFDEHSSQVRLDNLLVFSYFNWKDLLYGNMSETVLTYLDMNIIENPWIIWMLNEGLIALVVMLILVYPYYKYLYKNYTKKETLFLTSGFLLLASTNNSIAATYIPIVIFTILIKVFDPGFIHFYISQKYLQK